MLQSKWFTFSVSVLLVLSVAVNARLYVLWSSAHDEVYEMIHKAYVNSQRILSELEAGNVPAASNMLRREIEISGNIIAICAIEKCSKSIVVDNNEKP